MLTWQLVPREGNPHTAATAIWEDRSAGELVCDRDTNDEFVTLKCPDRAVRVKYSVCVVDVDMKDVCRLPYLYRKDAAVLRAWQHFSST